MTKKALGKGLGVFLPDDYGIIKNERYAEVAIDEVVPNPLQPRLKFDPQSIEELARSIRETGVIQPILVVPEGDTYKIIVGERRWRAAHKAGLKKIPVLIRQIPIGRQLEISLVENLHREDLNPLEIAHVYQRLVEELGHTQEEIATRVGKDRTSVANYLRLLNLPQVVQDYLSENKITMGHARALLALDNPDSQIALAGEIVSRNLTVRNVERLISGRKGRAAASKKPEFDPDLQALEEDLVRILGAKVTIAGSRKKGTIKIQYFSLDDLNRIYRTIKGGA
ncbi:MAG TPA: ParB/RepB/Spo0J family partition protein [Candidatus Desulfaltia sp.]|nr:ParB/RepB/Spo0J family partition protein [Candidatus Desulfaltia sp.]